MEWNRSIVVIVLIAASYFDIKEKRIPNFITFPAMMWGIIYSTICSGFDGLQFSLIGFAFGMAVFFIPFALGYMGAGDVKLMGAVGALMGWKFTLSALLYAALAGGVVVIAVAIYHRKIGRILLAAVGFVLVPAGRFLYQKSGNELILKIITFFQKYQFDKKKEYIPYGVAIAIGTLLVLSGAVDKIV